MSDAAIAALSAQESTSNAGSPATIPGKVSNPPYNPYTTGQKFRTATRGAFSPLALLGYAAGAGINQGYNTPWEWGQGAAGYADRFASNVGVGMSNQYFGFVLDSVFKQDPRYFLSPDRSTKARLRSVVKQLFVAKQDNGGEAFAVGKWGGAIGAGMLANAWQPHSTSSLGAGFRRSAYVLAGNVGLNLGKEFIPLLRRANP